MSNDSEQKTSNSLQVVLLKNNKVLLTQME
jgi:hypothetical protein